jgi:hypothetical protein
MLLTVGRLMGLAEIMRMFGVQRTQARNITEAEGFPAPYDPDLAMGRVWQRNEVVQWANDTGRTTFDQAEGSDTATEADT